MFQVVAKVTLTCTSFFRNDKQIKIYVTHGAMFA